jgi:hypothetical protein
MSGHGYVPYTHGCRCAICTTAKREYIRKFRAQNVFGRGSSYRHGTCNGYVNYMCRCDLCCGWRKAKTAREALRRQRVTS